MDERSITGRAVMIGEGEHWKIDKSAFSVSSLTEKQNDRDYWMSKMPEERFAAVELMRQINYGYDPATERLQRVLEVVEVVDGVEVSIIRIENP